jgi:cell division protein FtsQ
VTTRVKGTSAARRPARKTGVRRPRPSVDPRIRERRVAVVRAQGRRRLRWLVAILACAVLVAVGWLVTQSTLLDVDHVRVAGTQRVPAGDVRRASGVRPGDAILFVDTAAAQGRVEQLPWVDEARVERHLPGELEIQVIERVPAVWARRSPDSVALIDKRGRVLADTPEPQADLSELGGVATIPPIGQDVEPRGVAGVVGHLPAELRARVAAVVTSGGAVKLVLRDGPEVRLGPPDDIAAKARAAVAVLGTIGGAPPAYVDVRVPTAPVAA